MLRKISIAVLAALFLGFPLSGTRVAVLAELNDPGFDIVVDGDRLYVPDGSAVFIYSLTDYRLITKFGRRGEGPGELMGEVALTVLPDILFLSSKGKIFHFGKNGDFIKEIACPEELLPEPGVLGWVEREKGAVVLGRDARQAVQGADCVVTDTWVSMGDTDGARRKEILKPYSVDAALMAEAAPGAIFMHCLPAYRGHEVTADVIDGPQSVVFDEAENRLHAQKAILAWCLGAL